MSLQEQDKDGPSFLSFEGVFAWAEVVIFWGLAATAVIVVSGAANPDLSVFILTLQWVIFFTEFLVVHGGLMIGSTIVDKRGWSRWICLCLMLIFYLPFTWAIVQMTGTWLAGLATLFQIVRFAVGLKSDSGLQFKRRFISGFAVIFIPFLVTLLVSLLTGITEASWDKNSGPPDRDYEIIMGSWGVMLFFLIGLLCAPPFVRWMDENVLKHVKVQDPEDE
jgi:hypothetical protein